MCGSCNEGVINAGVGGLFDYGPIGCTLKENFLTTWRRHFVLEEDMLEIATVCMTPEVVLKYVSVLVAIYACVHRLIFLLFLRCGHLYGIRASGHVDRFTDLMVRDEKTSDCFRADKLLESTPLLDLGALGGFSWVYHD